MIREHNFHKQERGRSEIIRLQNMLEEEVHQKDKLEEEIAVLHGKLVQLTSQADEVCIM